MDPTRPHYIDLEKGDTADFDSVEFKYDGMWVRVEIRGRTLQAYSRTGKLKLATTLDRRHKRMTLIGEYIVGTTWAKASPYHGRIVVHDITHCGWRNLSGQALAERRHFLNYLPWPCLGTGQYALDDLPELLDRVEGGAFEGLVFKDSTEPYGAPHGRYKPIVTRDYVCMGRNPGSGKYAGWAAASIQGGLQKPGEFFDGTPRHVIDVGGLTDDLRASLWQEPDKYIGRVFKAAGNMVFESGALRHPRFAGWHEDKTPQECTG